MAIKIANTVNISLVYSLFFASGSTKSGALGFFSGAQPTAHYWSNNYDTGDILRNNYLGGINSWYYTYLTHTNTTGLTADSSYMTLNSTQSFTASATGTCGYVVWTNRSSDYALNWSAETNSTWTAFSVMILPVTDALTPGGIIRVDDVNFVSGSTVTITDFTFISSAGEP